MTTSGSAYGTGQESGLIVQQEGKPQRELPKFLNLMLNYQYGLTITVIQELDQAAELLLQEGTAARCVFVVQNNPLSNERTLDSLGHNGVLLLYFSVAAKRDRTAARRRRPVLAILSLTHMADNLCKKIGLGYLPEEPSRYDPRVIKKLKLVDGNVPVLREALAEDNLEEVKNMVDQCL